MDIGKTVPLCFLICFISLFFGWGHSTAVEPEVNKGISIQAAADAESSDTSKTIIKNPYGFLEYDGTGYRVVTREPKPDKASQVRMRPVTTKEKGTVYVLEVIDEKAKPAEELTPVNSGPRIAVERLENVEGRKGVAPAPVRETKADVGVGVKVSESSEVLLGRGVVVESKDNKNPDSRDDGWRFRFKTHF